MWYPATNRTNEIDRQIEVFEERPESGLRGETDFLLSISAAIFQLAIQNTVPSVHLRDWIWIGSQFRLAHGNNPKVRRITKGALLYLLESPQNFSGPSDETIREFNWVLDKSSSELTSLLGPNAQNRFLTREEQGSVDRELANLRSGGSSLSDEENNEIHEYVSRLASVSSDIYLPGIADTINRIVKFVDSQDADQRQTATACLRYIVKKNDVVPDTLGYLGLVDDIYAVETTFRDLDSKTAFKPILEMLNIRQPFVSRISFQEEGEVVRLDQYMNASLGLAFGDESERIKKCCMVMPETTVCGLLGAFIAALETIKTYSETGNGRTLFKKGDHIFLGGTDRIIKVIYAGLMRYEGQSFHSIFLRKGQRNIAGTSLAKATLAPAPHRTLSTEQEFHEWRKLRSPSPITHLIGNDFTLQGIKTSVLLITKKITLDGLIPEIKPMDMTIPQLVGVKYVTSTGREDTLPGTQVAEPLIIACSDALTGRDLIVDPNEGLDLKFVVIDDVDLAIEFENSCNPGDVPEETKVLVFGAQHQTEGIKELMAWDYNTWLLKQSDVDPTPLAKQSKGRRYGVMSKFLRRQAITSHVQTRQQEVIGTEIEMLFEHLKSVRKSLREPGGPEVDLVAISLSAFLNRYRAAALHFDDMERRELEGLLKLVAGHCSSHSDFDSNIRELGKEIQHLTDKGIPENPRQAIISKLIAESRGRTVVLCPSGPSAEKNSKKAEHDEILKKADWLSFNQLRSVGPVDRLIVSSWINKKTMREIRNCGYATHVDLVFYKFEHDMETKSAKAGLNWERLLLRRMRSQWKSIRKHDPPSDLPEFLNTEHFGQEETPEVDDNSDEDLQPMDDRVVEVIRRASRTAHQTEKLAKARLVVFEEAGTYIYLPPHGNVISMSKAIDAIAKQGDADLNKDDAVRLITSPVGEISAGDLLAFPEGDNTDLLDVFVNRSLPDPEEKKRLANLWREALKFCAATNRWTATKIQKKLEAGGLKRHAITIRNWLNHDTILAPQSFEESIKIISEVTQNLELGTSLREVNSAITEIYNKRSQAASELLKKLSDRKIDIEEGLAAVEIEGHSIHYRILRVQNIGPAEEINRDIMWVLGNVAEIENAPKQELEGGEH